MITYATLCCATHSWSLLAFAGTLFRYGFITTADRACARCPRFSIFPRNPIGASLRKRAQASLDHRSPPLLSTDAKQTIEVRVAYERAYLKLTPEQVLLAWKFHFIISTAILTLRPPLRDLSSAARQYFTSRPYLSAGEASKMYLVLPLTKQTPSRSPIQGDGEDDASSMEKQSSVAIDWFLVREVVRLAEEEIEVGRSGPSTAALGDRQPSNSIDLSRPLPCAPPSSLLSRSSPLDAREDFSVLSSFSLTSHDNVWPKALEEPVVLYSRQAPEHFFVFFRLRHDLTPAVQLLGTRKRPITSTDGLRSSAATVPQAEHRTFISHYLEKYGIEVSENQPLYEVFYLPRPKNLLRPAKSEAQEEVDSTPRQTTLFVIPELCRVHPISGQLLVDAFYLPSILWRTEMLFLVEEFVRLSGLSIGTTDDIWRACHLPADAVCSLLLCKRKRERLRAHHRGLDSAIL